MNLKDIVDGHQTLPFSAGVVVAKILNLDSEHCVQRKQQLRLKKDFLSKTVGANIRPAPPTQQSSQPQSKINVNIGSNKQPSAAASGTATDRIRAPPPVAHVPPPTVAAPPAQAVANNNTFDFFAADGDSSASTAAAAGAASTASSFNFFPSEDSAPKKKAVGHGHAHASSTSAGPGAGADIDIDSGPVSSPKSREDYAAAREESVDIRVQEALNVKLEVRGGGGEGEGGWG